MIKKLISNILSKKIISAYSDGEHFITQQINRYPKDHIKILDVGCHNGLITRQILKTVYKKYSIYGMDLLNKTDVDKQIHYKKSFFDNKNFPYKNNSFDIVYANQVIEHIIHKDRFIRECRRVLKKGGYCLLATENIASLDNVISVLLGQEPIAQHTSTDYATNSFLSPHFMKKTNHKKNIYHMGHKNVTSYYGLQRLMQVNGFKNTKIASFGHINKIFEKLLPIQNRVIVGFAKK